MSDPFPPRRLAGRRRPRIGLFGGSFNPAHEGHLHVSREALRRLGLDAVWWLVTPQNPLKPAKETAPLADRLEGARRVTGSNNVGRRIWVTDIEGELGTQHTADTLPALKRRYPRHRFVWIMGADNLVEIPRWQRWTAIFSAVPVAVFARPTYSFRALCSQAARRMARFRVADRDAAALVEARPPAWVFLHIPLNAASASSIRAGKGRRA